MSELAIRRLLKRLFQRRAARPGETKNAFRLGGVIRLDRLTHDLEYLPPGDPRISGNSESAPSEEQSGPSEDPSELPAPPGLKTAYEIWVEAGKPPAPAGLKTATEALEPPTDERHTKA